MLYEGIYSNDVRDRGGETWRGIARRMHPKWEGWAVIDEIKTNTNKNNLVKALEADEELDLMVRDFYKLVFWATNRTTLELKLLKSTPGAMKIVWKQ